MKANEILRQIEIGQKDVKRGIFGDGILAGLSIAFNIIIGRENGIEFTLSEGGDYICPITYSEVMHEYKK